MNFNPRSRVGNDKRKSHRSVQGYISIHVPAWGTTSMMIVATGGAEFQSTFPRGERPNIRPLTDKVVVFQSTFPRGERRRPETADTCCRHFNPRSRVGNDRNGMTMFVVAVNFNPRSRVGNDAFILQISCITWISIHVPAWGTTDRYSGLYTSQKFQSTFPRGERLSSCWFLDHLCYFNPRSRVGNDRTPCTVL